VSAEESTNPTCGIVAAGKRHLKIHDVSIILEIWKSNTPTRSRQSPRTAGRLEAGKEAIALRFDQRPIALGDEECLIARRHHGFPVA